MSAEHILITGGAGFLGSAIVHALLKRHPEFQYTVLDLVPPASWTPPRHDIRYLRVDIRDAAAVIKVVEAAAPTAIIHSASVLPAGSARYSQRDRAAFFRVNVDGTRNMIEAARRCGAKAFVYTSSVAVIGDDLDHDHPNVDETVPTGPKYSSLAPSSIFHFSSRSSTFSISQSPRHLLTSTPTAAEALVLAADDAATTLRTCALRPSVLFGPGETQLIPAIYDLIAAGSTPFIIGSGTNLYDFTYVTNAADAHVLAVGNLLSSTPTAADQAIFISNFEPVPFRDFCRAVWVRFGHVPWWEVRLPRSVAKALAGVADVVGWVFGIDFALCGGSVREALGVNYVNGERARRILGYVPRVGLSEGVRISCEDYKLRLAGVQNKIE